MKFMGIEYGRGCLKTAIDGGPALATTAVKKMFPDATWTTVTAEPFSADECARDRFGENFKIQQAIYAQTPSERHIMIGGDHSVNFGHFAALADRIPDTDLCLIYIDAHLDIHNPESAVAQASGAPHGCNVRALLGDGDSRWLTLQSKCPAVKAENIFYLGIRSFEPAEINFVRENNIYVRMADELKTREDWTVTISEIRERIANKPFVVSLDFDVLDPKYFSDILVPAENGISADAAEFLVDAFKNAYGFEFVEYAPTGDKQSNDIAKHLIGIVANAQKN